MIQYPVNMTEDQTTSTVSIAKTHVAFDFAETVWTVELKKLKYTKWVSVPLPKKVLIKEVKN